MTASAMDGLPGIGPVRRRALLQHFGSLERVMAASREELAAAPGLPAKVSRDLFEHIHKTGSPELIETLVGVGNGWN